MGIGKIAGRRLRVAIVLKFHLMLTPIVLSDPRAKQCLL